MTTNCSGPLGNIVSLLAASIVFLVCATSSSAGPVRRSTDINNILPASTITYYQNYVHQLLSSHVSRFVTNFLVVAINSQNVTT